MSRWFVGSSSSRRSGCDASARASDARVSSPPENVESGRSRSSSVKPRPRTTERRGRASRSRLHARAAPAPPSSAAASPGRASPPAIACSSVAQLLLDRREVGGAREHVFAQRAGSMAGGRWSCSAIRAPFSSASSPPSIDHLAGERAQQRRLPGAVRPCEREPVAALDLERDAVEEDVSGELLAECGCDQDRHGANYPPASYADRRARRRLVLSPRNRLRRGRDGRSPATRTFAYVTHDADELVDACRAVLAQVGERDALALSCFWHSLLALDERDRPTSPVLTWRDVAGDRRPLVPPGVPPPHRLLPAPGVLAGEAPRPRRVARYVSFADYLLLRCDWLSCARASSPSERHRALRPERLSWDDETLGALGLDAETARARLRRAGRRRVAGPR